MEEKINEEVAWARRFTTFQTMTKRLASKKTGSEKTEHAYAHGLKLFHQFSGMTPDDIVSKWIKDVSENYDQALETWDMKLDDFMNWLMQREVKRTGEKLKKSTAVYCHTAVRALIKWNSRRKLTIETPSKGIIESLIGLTLEEIHDLTELASPQQKWIILGLKDSGMSREDFAKLTYGHVKRDLQAGLRVIQMQVVRRKEEVKYRTHLGPNAINALKLYLKLRTQRGENLTDASPLTLNEVSPYNPTSAREITQVVTRLGDKLGIKASPHRLRKSFETYLSLHVKHPIVLKYWMGHNLKMTDIEAAYVIPHPNDQRKLYEEGYKHLDIEIYASVEEREKAIREITEKIMKGEALEDSDREKIRRFGIRLGKKRAEPEPKETNCADGVHCGEFKQIHEENLLTYLQEGWKIVHKLSAGDLIVSR